MAVYGRLLQWQSTADLQWQSTANQEYYLIINYDYLVAILGDEGGWCHI